MRGRTMERGRLVLTEIWESDPFTEKRESIIDTLETDYHWDKGETFVVTRGGGRDRFRVLRVQVEIGDDGLKRQILALRIE